jgi:hypothetical protein
MVPAQGQASFSHVFPLERAGGGLDGAGGGGVGGVWRTAVKRVAPPERTSRARTSRGSAPGNAWHPPRRGTAETSDWLATGGREQVPRR